MSGAKYLQLSQQHITAS